MMDGTRRASLVNPYAKRKRSEATHNRFSKPRILPVKNNDCNQCAKKDTLSAQASALIISASEKAGMEGIDRSKIDAIILRESGNSLFMQQQRRRDEKVNERVRQLQQKMDQASPEHWEPSKELDQLLLKYQRSQGTRATCVVVDMDMFYMACELLTRPDLRDKPACVGRGMILTSNYVARKYGVRSAMAGFIGDKLVEELSGGTEQLIHVRSNFDLYKEKSKIVQEVIKEYDPFNTKSYSLDEVYLDIGPYLVMCLQHRDYNHQQIKEALLKLGKSHPIPSVYAEEFLQSQSPKVCLEVVDAVVARLRSHVRTATGGLTCSAGVARTHKIAKIASDKNKPNGQLVVDPGTTLEFVWKMPIRKIPGIGRVTEKLLKNVCGIHSGKDLYEKRGLVEFLFQPATARFLLRASVGCSGRNERTETDDDHQKGISRERSFSPETDWGQLNNRLEDIGRMVAEDMIRKSVVGHTVTVKVKLETFDVLSRSQSMRRGVYLQTPEQLVRIARDLFAAIKDAHLQNHNKFAVRLLGIRSSNLVEKDCAKKQGGTIDRFLMSQPLPPRSEEVGKSLESGTGDFDVSTSISKNGEIPHRVVRDIGEDSQQVHCVSLASPKHENLAMNAAIGTVTGHVTDESKPRFVRCPLCSRSFSQNDNEGLNAHIDTCLNGVHGTSIVRRAIEEEESRLGTSPSTGQEIARKKRQLLTDFWRKCET